jgi:hypothetical protein
LLFAQAVQRPAGLPEDADSMRIVVESVSGKVQFMREGKAQRVNRDSELRHGDKIVADVGAMCKLEFLHPTSNAVLSAVIMTGYSDLLVSEAYLQGERSRTQLDLSQGVVRAGVVRTAVPPTYRVRTPRTVVAVRGTEIAMIESSERGDVIMMGQIGIGMVHDSIPWFRSVRAGQGTEKPIAEDWRGGRLLRAIENALLESRVVLHGPHRRRNEVHFDRDNFDLVEFPGDNMSGADPNWERLVNEGRISTRGCTNCRAGNLGGANLAGQPGQPTRP